MSTTATATAPRYRTIGPWGYPPVERRANRPFTKLGAECSDWLARRRAERPILTVAATAPADAMTAAGMTAAERRAEHERATIAARDAWTRRHAGTRWTPAELLARCTDALSRVRATDTEREDALGPLMDAAARKGGGYSPHPTDPATGRLVLSQAWLARNAAGRVADARATAEHRHTLSADALEAERVTAEDEGGTLGPWALAYSRAARVNMVRERTAATVGATELAERIGATDAERTALTVGLLREGGRDGSGQAVADALGISPGALRFRVHAGAERLRSRFTAKAFAAACRDGVAGVEGERYSLTSEQRLWSDAIAAADQLADREPHRCRSIPARVIGGGAVMAGGCALRSTDAPTGRLTSTPAERAAAAAAKAERLTEQRAAAAVVAERRAKGHGVGPSGIDWS